MKITPKQYAESLIQSLSEVSKDQKDFCIGNFIKIVDGNNNAGLLPLIVEEAGRISDAKEGLARATAIAALPLSDEMEQAIAGKLESMFKVKIKLKSAVNPDILGGLIIEFNNEILDRSTRAWISGLRQNLS